MLRYAADENLDGRLLKGLMTRLPDLDILRVQDSMMAGAADPDLLAWLAQENRILLTHDAKTMPMFVYDRVRQGLPVPGVIEIRLSAGMGLVLDELEVLLSVGVSDDFLNCPLTAACSHTLIVLS